MTAIPIDRWSESDLRNLIGQPESARLEFKSGRLFSEPQGRWTETLSKELSAFANSEGGLLVIGVQENEGVATALDGVERAQIPTQKLHDILLGALSPALPGIRLKAISLSGDLDGRVCFVVEVPHGNTAYQANDKRYYGRSELSVRALPDHDVRLRMQRGLTPRGLVEMRIEPDFPNDEDFGTLAPFEQERLSDELHEIPPEFGNAGDALQWLFFRLAVRNAGEVTLRDFSLALHWTNVPEVDLGLGGKVLGQDMPFTVQLGPTAPIRVFPGQALTFPDELFTAVHRTTVQLPPDIAILRWELFLDNAPPQSGAFDLAQEWSKTPQRERTKAKEPWGPDDV